MGVYEEVLDNHRKWKQGYHKPMRLGVTKKVRNAACLTRGTYARLQGHLDQCLYSEACDELSRRLAGGAGAHSGYSAFMQVLQLLL